MRAGRLVRTRGGREWPIEILTIAREALEEDFFRRENAQRLSALRESKEREAQRQALVEAMAVHDETTLDQLLDVGIRAETWHAITLVPLCEVAWADREISQAERQKILEAASDVGIEIGSDGYLLLEHWLSRRPPSSLRGAWKTYVAAVHAGMGESEKEALRRHTLERAEEVARATNHLLGFGRRVSEVEASVLEDLASVL